MHVDSIHCELTLCRCSCVDDPVIMLVGARLTTRFAQLPFGTHIATVLRHASSKVGNATSATLASTTITEKQLLNTQDIFADMAELRALEGETFRSVSYQKASAALKHIRQEILSMGQTDVPLSTVEAHAGLGKGMMAKLLEIVNSSDGKTLAEHQKLSSTDLSKSARFIMSVHGFGPKRAAGLAKEHKGVIQDLQSLAALQTAEEEFTKAQCLGIKYHEDSTHRIPREEVEKHVDVLKQACHAVDPALLMEVCGSYRRQLPTAGDVDCLIAYPIGHTVSGTKKQQVGPLDALVTQLESQKYIVGVLAKGQTKAMAYARLSPHTRARRLDVRWVDSDEFPTALLYFTGSAAFNARMRGLALAAGYTLNEYGLFHLKKQGTPGKKPAAPFPTHASHRSTKGDKRVPVKSERDVFDAIGMAYVEPRDRID
jgi:DNA polymerase beta